MSVAYRPARGEQSSESHQLGSDVTGNDEIDNLLPLGAGEVKAYLMQDGTKQSLIDDETGLVDDALLEQYSTCIRATGVHTQTTSGISAAESTIG